MAEHQSLYDNDFLAWSKQQAEALRVAMRDGSNQSLDFGNLAEEIEDLGKSVRRELQSQIRRVVRHLLKLDHSPAREPRRDWALRATSYTAAQVLGDWFPKEPPR